MSVWSDLPGQSAVIEQLSRAAAAERPAHAWLFTGPPGSRVRSTVRPIARRRCSTAVAWVDFPAPSPPSNAMKRPLALAGWRSELT